MKSPDVEILNAVFTPMHVDGAINYDRIPDLFEHSIRTGAKGVFLNGTTGECMSLSVVERNTLVEKWVAYRAKINRPDFKIFVHVGTCNLFEAIEMAGHAQDLGVDGIAMVSTFYFRPNTLAELIAQCEYVATAVPDTPFYYYNIPSLTGVDFPMISFLESAAKRIPNFAGLKNSHSDLADYQRCIDFAKENYALYWGTDQTFMALYAAGNRHYVGSTYNYMSQVYQKMLEAHLKGNMKSVTSTEAEAESFYNIILQDDGISAGKEVMNLLGIACGPVRRPLKPFTKAESAALLRKLKETTFFNYAVGKENLEADAHS
ncbi:MAG: dihydrodipicolinate synthase family protein [Cyclobacteriaceae bacterium]|nr:dihydrodipicolinate synthase family protein [Cyclobacteriaceae bacterium]